MSNFLLEDRMEEWLQHELWCWTKFGFESCHLLSFVTLGKVD